MAYCTADTDVRPIVLQITDQFKTDDEIAYFIDRSDDYINSRLSELYTVPFASTPPLIRQISSHLSAYFTIRSLYVQSREADDSSWMMEFKNWALQLLKEIEDGIATIVDSNGTRLSRTSKRGITITGIGLPSIFNLDDPINWTTPSIQLENIADQRERGEV